VSVAQIVGQGSLSEEFHQSAISNKTLVGRNFTVGYLEPILLDYPVDGTIFSGAHGTGQNKLDSSVFGQNRFYPQISQSIAVRAVRLELLWS